MTTPRCTTDIPMADIIASVLSAGCGEQVDTGGAMPLTVNRRLWAAGVAPEVAHEQPASEVLLTQDGHRAVTEEWHTGLSVSWTYVERWTPEGRTFHGWVDADSRKLIQPG